MHQEPSRGWTLRVEGSLCLASSRVTASRSDEPREAAGVITEELLHPIKEFQLLPGEISEALDLSFEGQLERFVEQRRHRMKNVPEKPCRWLLLQHWVHNSHSYMNAGRGSKTLPKATLLLHQWILRVYTMHQHCLGTRDVSASMHSGWQAILGRLPPKSHHRDTADWLYKFRGPI